MSKPSNTASQNSGGFKMSALVTILILFVVAQCIYHFVFGASGNFEGGDPAGHPVKEGLKSYLALIYKGGPVVPFLLTAFLVTITFSIERLLTLRAAAGNGKVADFIRAVKGMLDRGDVNGAIAACDKQRGSVANVIRSGLTKYGEMAADTTLAKDQKVLAIQKEVEEATSLEMPMLEKNLTILSTVASVGTLIALLGTVIGMIKAFKALATAGSPDAVALSTGISEALINTALGIGTSAIAIIAYNYFTSSVDETSYNIEEASFSMTQSFASKHK